MRVVLLLLAFVPFLGFLSASVVSLVHGHPYAAALFGFASLILIPEYHAR